MEIDLDKLLDHITANVYDEHRGLWPDRVWVVNARSLLRAIARACNLTDDEMERRFDEARARVHSPSNPARPPTQET